MAFFKKIFGKKKNAKEEKATVAAKKSERDAEEEDLIQAGILEEKPVAKPEKKTETVKSEEKAEIKPAAKKAPAKAEFKTEEKAEAKPAAKKTPAKAEFKTEEKAEIKPAAKKAPAKAEFKTEGKAEAKPAAKKTPEKVEATVEEKSVEEIDAAFKEETSADISKEVALAEAKSGRALARFEIKKSKDNRFVFNLYAPNRVIVATSQIYSSSPSAVNGIKSIAINAPKAPIEDTTLKSYTTLGFPKWEIYTDKAGQYRFRLYAPNGSCIVHSQGYTTKASCKNGIASIVKNAPEAIIDKSYLKKEDK